VKTKCVPQATIRSPGPEEAPLRLNLSPLRLRRGLEEHAAGQTPAAATKGGRRRPFDPSALTLDLMSHTYYDACVCVCVCVFEGGKIK